MAHPEADLKGPGTEGVGVLQALQLQGTDQGRRAAELVERQQSERVPHQDAQPRRFIPRILQSAIDQGEGRESQVGLRLAAACREEEEVHDLPVVMMGIDDARQVHQQEGELEWPPGRRIDRGGILPLHRPAPTSSRLGHDAVGETEGLEDVRIRESRDAILDALGGGPRTLEQGFGDLPAFGCEVGKHFCLVSDPGAVLDDERLKRLLGLGKVLQPGESFHPQSDARDLGRGDALDVGRGDPARADGATGAVIRHEGPRRDAVTDGELVDVAVLEIGHALIPVGDGLPAQVGAGN